MMKFFKGRKEKDYFWKFKKIDPNHGYSIYLGTLIL
jgi:hypothetical protein